MREKIIKLLKSNNEDDKNIGKLLLFKFFEKEIREIADIKYFGGSESTLIFGGQLRKILQTEETFNFVFYYKLR